MYKKKYLFNWGTPTLRSRDFGATGGRPRGAQPPRGIRREFLRQRRAFVDRVNARQAARRQAIDNHGAEPDNGSAFVWEKQFLRFSFITKLIFAKKQNQNTKKIQISEIMTSCSFRTNPLLRRAFPNHVN